MSIRELLQAAFLGLVEGVTEFLPVSSTGHLILFVDLLGFQGPPGKVFEIVIQLGAIAAVVVTYFRLFRNALLNFRTDPAARLFVLNLAAGLAPALVVGGLFGSSIKEALFSAEVVAWALIAGGIAILFVERLPLARTCDTIDGITPRKALLVGLAQVAAMIPGVSRSGATIMGGLLCGLSRRTAAEFSFLLAAPTLVAASAHEIWSEREHLDSGDAILVLAGSLTAFASAWLVIRGFIALVSRHGFAPFAWYRILVGILVLSLR